MPDKVIQSAKTVDRIKYASDLAKMEIANKIGIRVSDLDQKDVKKIEELMAKHNKPVEFLISFDGSWFGYSVRVGSVKTSISSVDVASVTDKEKVLNNLVIYGAATTAQVDAFRKKNPDKKELEGLKNEIAALEKKIAEDQKKLEELRKKYKDKGGK